MSSTFICRGCSCNFVDLANLKFHLNAFPVCKTKKSPSSSSSNAVVAFNPSKGKVKSSSSNPKVHSNLQPVGTKWTKRLLKVSVWQQVPIALALAASLSAFFYYSFAFLSAAYSTSLAFLSAAYSSNLALLSAIISSASVVAFSTSLCVFSAAVIFSLVEARRRR